LAIAAVIASNQGSVSTIERRPARSSFLPQKFEAPGGPKAGSIERVFMVPQERVVPQVEILDLVCTISNSRHQSRRVLVGHKQLFQSLQRRHRRRFRSRRITGSRGHAIAPVVTVLEQRTLLTGILVGIDFDRFGDAPAGFLKFDGFFDATFDNLMDVDGNQTPIDATIDLPALSSFQSSTSTLPGAQIPMSTPALNLIDGNYRFDVATATGPFEVQFEGLAAGEDHEVYFFGVAKWNAANDQTVTITGETSITFAQNLGMNDLFINDELGDSARTLESFAKIVAADSEGRITVSLTTDAVMTPGGVAIRPIGAAPAPGNIGGTLWTDDNSDGVFDATESGRPGETVYLDINRNAMLDAGEPQTTTLVDDARTTDVDESGTYEFLAIAAGEYYVRTIAPVGMEVTTSNGGETIVDLDPSDDAVVDFGVGNFAGIIAGFVWDDADGNGIFHPGELPIPGRTVYLDTNDNGALDIGEPTQTTAVDDPGTAEDESGFYEFTELPAGDYIVRQQLMGADVETAPRASDSVFNLQLNFGGGLSDSQKKIFFDAAAKWESIIVGNLPASGSVDDIVISASARYIDGPSGVLGSAGPRSLRSGSSLPAGGSMSFDTADIDNLEANGGLTPVVLHEMGHALGFTSDVWSALSLVDGLGTSTPTFSGTNAVAEYNAIFGLSSTTVPVENNGGPGTAGSHWEESVFDEELMTGFYDGGRPNPLSRVTVGAFEDMGYDVDYRGAEAYSATFTAGPVATEGDVGEGGYFVTEPVFESADTDSESLVNVSSDAGVYRVTLGPAEPAYQVRFGVQPEFPPNRTPTATDATFSVVENSADETAVGIVQATDPDAADDLSFAITAGNVGNAFQIDADSGAITVATSSQIDYETTQSFTLTVTVTDDGTPALSDAATITINVTDIDDVNDAPVVDLFGGSSETVLEYVRGTGSVSIFDEVLITDADDTQLTQAIVQVSTGYVDTEDVLGLSAALPTGISTSGFDSVTGQITLSGTATIADYAAALKLITYENALANNTDVRTITATVQDANAVADPLGVMSGIDTRDINVVKAGPDLLPVAFNAVSDHLPTGQTDVVITIQNAGDSDSIAFSSHVVWSADDIPGNEDDVLVSGSLKMHDGLAAGLSTTATIGIEIDRGLLYAHATTATPPGLPVGSISTESSRLFLIVDVNNDVVESDEANNVNPQNTVGSDDITYFPWDQNGNGSVEPLEALGAIQALGIGESIHDYDGNGAVTPLEALSSIQRIGYVRNEGVMVDGYAGMASATDRTQPKNGSVAKPPVLATAGMAPVLATPVLRAADTEASSPTDEQEAALSWGKPEEQREDLFPEGDSQIDDRHVRTTESDSTADVDDSFSDVEWLNIL